ncbi:MAG TPA: hypothetical protein VID95_03195 [Candidatus Limnocylindrales bacterium]|jgi:hypothetical protein
MLVRLAVAALLLAHAGIHVALLAPPPRSTAEGPLWPFSTSGSWLFGRLRVRDETARLVAFVLVATTIAGFSLAALSVIGVLPAGTWPPAVAIGAVSSIGLLLVFFHPWLALGIGIDLVLLWASWSPVISGPQVQV